ncbi:MAG: hypothetical protein WCK47_02075 [bacterium]|nr:hypothetical protein [Candidatus Sumerlaeota bacterium]
MLWCVAGFGAVPAVMIGGIGTLIVVALWAWRFPELRMIGRLDHIRGKSVKGT